VSAGTDNLPPRAAVSQMATGYWVSQAVRAMAVLSLADHLASGPRTAADLAEATGAHAPSLARLLRALVALGLCGREATERFRLTPLGEALRSDVPDSARSFVLFFTAPWFERGWEELRASRPSLASTAPASGTIWARTRRTGRSSTPP